MRNPMHVFPDDQWMLRLVMFCVFFFGEGDQGEGWEEQGVRVHHHVDR
jgi:hypothetical protein